MVKLKALAFIVLLLIPLPFAITNVSGQNSPRVGTMFYVWYGYNSTAQAWTGGNRTSHWNDSPYGVCVDIPFIGFYNSMDNRTLEWQFNEIVKAKIDFIIVSYWGWGVTNFSNPAQVNKLYYAIDNATKNLFKYLDGKAVPLNVAIMVEPFSSNMNYTQVYNYIWENYYSKYDGFVLKFNGKPLLFFFNPLSPPPDSRYITKVVGHQSNVDIFFWRGMDTLEAYGGNVNILNYVGDPVISKDGFVSIIPRYDDKFLYDAGSRGSYMIFDKTFAKKLYDKEWDFVLRNKDKISFVIVYSWNEYHERTSIEPHFDLSGADTVYLRDLTAYYVSRLKASSTPTVTVYSPSLAYTVAYAIIAVFAVSLIIKALKNF